MNADDPKFTAHVLGEFEDLTPAERAEIEALIANDPTAAAAGEETRSLAARLRAELPGEAAGALDAEQRAAVLTAAKTTEMPASKVVRFPRRAAVLAALAACVIVGVSYALLFRMFESERAAKPTGAASSPEVELLAVPPPPPPDPSAAQLAAADPAAPQALEERLKMQLKDAPKLADAQPAPAMPKLEPMVRAEPSPQAMAKPLPSSPSVTALTTTTLATPEIRIAAVPATKAMAVPQDAAIANAMAARGNLRSYDTSVSAGTAAPVGQLAKRGALITRYSPEKDFVPDGSNTSTFDAINENTFLSVRENPLSTFSIDVDTASYAIVRRYLNDNNLPPKGAVRVEELLNYFTYDYPQPKGDAPFSATMEVAACPWSPEHRLVRVGLKGREIPKDQRPPSNLVFLIDISGSMNMPNKLPLIQKCFNLLVEQLGPKDRVSIVTYASGTRVELEPTENKEAMQAAIARLHADGCTYGSSGIELAYKLAEKSFIQGGTNRVILATDGDWNVGITDERELMQMITAKAKSGVFLTVLGCGMDNLKDSMLVKLADHGNGHYAYIDTEREARKVFVDQLSSTLVTIAKDVKIQVEFNPVQVSSYRLIGYEKRLLAKEDFNNDKKDAGEIGAGHTVTALYEVVPVGKEEPEIATVDTLKYQPIPRRAIPLKQGPNGRLVPAETVAPVTAAPAPAVEMETIFKDAATNGSQAAAQSPHRTIIAAPDRDGDAPVALKVEPAAVPVAVRNEMLTLKLRYKEPDGEKSKLLEFPLTDRRTTWEKSSPDFRFAAAVASYGMLLRGSNYMSEATWRTTAEWAREGLGTDENGYRAEFLTLLEKARALKQ